MIRLRLLCAAGLLACYVASPPPAQAADLGLISQTTSAGLPMARADFPHPDDPDQLFFIQRSANENTVVYAARYDASGNLTRRHPIDVFWRRFQTTGEKKQLKWYEDSFAYGVSARKNRTEEGFSVTFAALSDFEMTLRQSGPNEAALWTKILDRDYKLIYAFLELDQSGMIDKVVRMQLYTYDPEAKHFVTHLISVSGGTITQ